jgi:hypothetical protein
MKKTDPISELVRLLAAGDALFSPVRDWRHNAHVTAIMQRRWEYRTQGLAYLSGSGEGGRQQAEHQAALWESEGLVTFTRSGGRRCWIRLTGGMDWKLRAMGGLPGWPEQMVVLLAVQEQTQAGYLNGRFVPEDCLVGRGWGSRQALILSLRLAATVAPSLVRGWLVSSADLGQRLGYAITPEGRAALDNPEAPTDLPSVHSGVADAYDAALKVEQRLLASIQPTPSGVVIPLSGGLWPADSQRAPGIPPVFHAGRVRSLASMVKAVQTRVAAARRAMRQ